MRVRRFCCTLADLSSGMSSSRFRLQGRRTINASMHSMHDQCTSDGDEWRARHSNHVNTQHMRMCSACYDC